MENIRPSITLVDDQNSDKVMTEKPFETPAFKGNENIFTLSAIYSDHMVLQANMNCRIFGKYAGEGNQVAACLEQVSTGEKRTFYGAVDDAGEFEIWLGATGYGGPYTSPFLTPRGTAWFSRMFCSARSMCWVASRIWAGPCPSAMMGRRRRTGTRISSTPAPTTKCDPCSSFLRSPIRRWHIWRIAADGLLPPLERFRAGAQWATFSPPD